MATVLLMHHIPTPFDDNAFASPKLSHLGFGYVQLACLTVGCEKEDIRLRRTHARADQRLAELNDYNGYNVISGEYDPAKERGKRKESTAAHHLAQLRDAERPNAPRNGSRQVVSSHARRSVLVARISPATRTMSHARNGPEPRAP